MTSSLRDLNIVLGLSFLVINLLTAPWSIGRRSGIFPRRPRCKAICARLWIARSIRARGSNISREKLSIALISHARNAPRYAPRLRERVHAGGISSGYGRGTAICSFRFPTGCLRISFYSSYVAGTAPK